MRLGNFERELAEQRVEEEKEVAIANARKALSCIGRVDCDECGRPIREARRKAMPSATRCFACQEAHEEGKRR
ncbi:hypothetical protein D3C80_2095150 [compost metagenome]